MVRYNEKDKKQGGNMKKRVVFSVLILSLFISTIAFSGNLQETVNAINNSKINGVVKETPIKTGNMEILAGKIYSLNSSGENTGLYIPDEGSFTLIVKDPYSIPVCKRNASNWHIPFEIKGNTLVLKKKFKRAILFTTDFWFKTQKANESRSISPSIEKFIEENEHINPGLDLESAILENNERTVALFETTLGYFYYIFDPDKTASETLYYMRKSKYTDLYEIFEIIFQPFNRKIYEIPESDFTVKHLGIEVTNKDGDEVKIKTNLKIKVNSTLNGLSFKLINNYYTFNRNTKEVSERKTLTVKALKVNGRDSDFVHNSNKLLVKLNKKASMGDEISMEVTLEGNILQHPQGATFWKLGNIAWYPKANLNEEQANLDIKATVPEKFSVFASGNTETVKRNKGRTLIETHLDFPVQRPVICAGRYYIHTKKMEGRKCLIATHGTKKKKASKKLLNYFFAASEILSNGFNKPYPFKDQCIIETDYRKYEEGPSIILIGKKMFDPKNEGSETLNLSFIQKISKAFWGYMINIPDENEKWIAESFSEYTAALTYKNLFKKRKVGEKKFKKILRLWKRGSELVGDRGTIYTANHISRRFKKDTYDKLHLLYDKGPLTLHALRTKMQKKYGKQNGDRMFFIWMSSILKSFKGRYVNTYDCIRLLNMITKDDWTPFFERYVFGDETPEVNF